MIREREQMVFGWAASAAVPVAFVLAGGYSGASLSRDALVDLHRLTIAAAAGWHAVTRSEVPEPLVVRMGVLSRKEFESVPSGDRQRIEEGTAVLLRQYGRSWLRRDVARHRADLELAYGVELQGMSCRQED